LGGAFVQVKRKSKPRHTYEIDVSNDRRSIVRLHWTDPAVNDGPRMNPLEGIEHFADEARKAAEELLRIENEGTGHLDVVGDRVTARYPLLTELMFRVAK
jgi:hypothetical protein